MNSPRERADELIEKFEQFADYNECDVFTQRENRFKNAKQCALIAVDEILNIESFHLLNSTLKNDIDYWQEVKLEIEKL